MLSREPSASGVNPPWPRAGGKRATISLARKKRQSPNPTKSIIYRSAGSTHQLKKLMDHPNDSLKAVEHLKEHSEELEHELFVFRKLLNARILSSRKTGNVEYFDGIQDAVARARSHAIDMRNEVHLIMQRLESET
jgi:uncharacterized protein (DUF2164 family)